MNRFHFLTEAEIDKAKDKLLAQLSDEDLESIVSELDEAPMSNDQMRAGRFGFNPLKQPAVQRQPIKQEPKPQAKQEPKPQAKQEPKPQPKKVEPARKAEIKQTVDQLKPKEKTALVKAAKAELKKREATPKEVKPAQPGTLKKVVKNLALAAVAATVIGGMFGGGNDTPSDTDSTPQATVVQTQGEGIVQPFKHTDGATYYTLDAKTPDKNTLTLETYPGIKIYLGKRVGKSGTSYSIYAVDLKSGKGVKIRNDFRTDFDSEDQARKQFNNSIKNAPLMRITSIDSNFDTYDLVPGSSQYIRYMLLKDKFGTEETEISPAAVKNVMDKIIEDDPQVLSYDLQGNELNITIDPKIITGYNNFVLARSKGGQLQQGDEPSDALDYYGFNDSYIESIKSKVPGLNKVTFSVGTSSGGLMTGEDFMSIAKRMTLPGMPDPANDPNTENFARIIDLDNGKYFNIPKPVRGEEAEIFQSIMLGAITDAVSVQRDPNVDKDEFLKSPLRTTLRYSLGKRYPVTEDLDRLKKLAGI